MKKKYKNTEKIGEKQRGREWRDRGERREMRRNGKGRERRRKKEGREMQE